MSYLYHATSAQAAESIQREGFRESSLHDIAFGVWLSDRPLDHGDDVARDADVCFRVEVPEGTDLTNFEVVEDAQPPEAYREWIVPVVMVNSWKRHILVEAED